ncbi:MAG: hypothetical protein WDN08_18370 [Rhizomicrobium sp.]
MKGWVRRAFCAVAGSLALASAAFAAAPAVDTFTPLNAPAGALDSTVDLSQTFSLPEASYGPPAAQARLSVSNVATSVALITGLDLELGYKVDLAGRLSAVDAGDTHAFNGLFLSAASSGNPYASLASGGDFLGAAAALADDLHVSVGVASLAPGFSTFSPDAYTALARLGGVPAPYTPRSATSLLAGVAWDIAEWGELGLIGSHTTERDSILGSPAPGAAASTSALGVAARVRLGNGWVTTASYSEGITQLDLKPGIVPVPLGDDVRSRSYGIAIAKNGLFGDDALGLAVSRPVLGGGSGEFITMPGSTGRPAFFSRNHLLEGAATETDVEIGYITTFLDGSLALQTNASFQMNYAGQYGTNAVSLLSRARIKF